MRFPIKTVVVLLVLGGIGTGSYAFLAPYWKEWRRPKFRHVEVDHGSIVAMVNATGTVQPVESVSVGSFVSGPIAEVLVDFNDVVKKDDVLALIDPRIYQANVDRDQAQLGTRMAEKARIEALLQQARNNERRALELKEENEDFISGFEMDQFMFERISLEAQLELAKASIKQAEANLNNSMANLGYTKIRSPVSGVIIDRKIDEGQTVAASFQTPELFIVAPDLKTMHIHATVDEADIGLINKAKEKNLPVRFTVDAYPEELFEGEIYQIRKSSSITQNVVTYPVIVKTENPDSKLLPGMTASLSFQVDEVEETLRIPNAALRFYPEKSQVHPDDRKILEGVQRDSSDDEDTTATNLTAEEKAEGRKKSYTRHVWVENGEYLRAIEVRTGISNNKYTQHISGELVAGQSLVTGIKKRK